MKSLSETSHSELCETMQKMYKETEAAFWTVDEIDLATDVQEYKTLQPKEKVFIERVLAFFAASDGIVCENLVGSFLSETKLVEAKRFYSMQCAIESVHSEMYSLLIETLVDSSERKEKLFKAINEYPTINKKARWALKYMDKNLPFKKRLIAFAAIEGIFFCSSFAAIYWIKKRGIMPGLTFSNELIARDESAHRDFACVLYFATPGPSLTNAEILEILVEAAEIEQEFVEESLVSDLMGMKSDLMKQYVKVVCDNLLVYLGLPRHYDATNPFDFMEMINMQGKTNFFEKRVGEYQKAGVTSGYENQKFSLSQDF